MSVIIVKDPSAILDYKVDWNQGYLQDGETIVSTASLWYISPTIGSSTTLNVDGSTLSTSAQQSIVTLSLGLHPTRYKVTNRVTTSAGRTDERTFFIQMWEPR